MKIKKIIWIVGLILLMLITTVIRLSAQSKLQNYTPPQTYVYKDLGNYNVKYPDGSSIGVRAYILKGTNTTGNYPQYSTVFTLMAESISIYNRNYTETWLYGVRVYLNGIEVTHNQYPQGFTSYIKTSPTVIYYWYTNDSHISEYFFNWESSSYEVR